jgi:hypothetical protein
VSVKLAFDLERRFGIPEKAFTGKIKVTADKTVDTKALSVSLNWKTAGAGNSRSGTAVTAVAHRGQLPMGESDYPFEIVVPPGPLSYSGTNLEVVWTLSATADIAWALDPSVEERINVVPGPDPVALDVGDPKLLYEAGPETTGSVVAGTCFTLVFIGIALTMLAVGVSTGNPAPFFMGVIFGLVGVFVLWIAVLRNLLARRKLGPVELEVSPIDANRGGVMTVKVRFTPRADVNLNVARATFLGEEEVVKGGGKHRHRKTHQILSMPIELAGAQRINAGEPTELATTFTVPDQAPYSFKVSDNEVTWKVTVRLDIAGWPDWERDVSFRVLPKGYTARAKT